MLTVEIPTINDNINGFDRLFQIWEQVNGDRLNVRFDFSKCYFLQQNAVAFLGGLAWLIRHRSGTANFDWDTLTQDVRKNLEKNRFISTFESGIVAPHGNAVPYRMDLEQDEEGIIDYLKTMWLGRDWVHVSTELRNAIVGRVWEIYDNAFQHRESPIGVFSCGQRYPRIHQLKLAVVDFGVGIPSNVRRHFNRPKIGADKALDWAFRRGTTTKSMCRGMGLELLKDFIKTNHGKLEFFSNEGYGIIDSKREEYSARSRGFEGTLVNITLRCDESSYYVLASEVGEPPGS